MARRTHARRNIVDSIVGYFNPRAGLRRTVAREMLHRAYEGANQRDGWKPRRSGASANADHQADAEHLRVRSRALQQNVPYIAQGMRSLVAQTVGTGITPLFTGPHAAVLNALWTKWAPFADADGRTNVYGQQALSYRTMEGDGEVLLRARTRRPTDGLPVPLQFQILEIDWLDSKRNEARGNNQIINGIEYDPLGRKVAYWLFTSHPGDTWITRMMGRVGLRSESRPVPAAQIIHLFNPDRPGQGRGITRLAPIIPAVRDLHLYEDAEAQRKNLETRLAVLATGDTSALQEDPADGTGEGGDASRTGDLGALPSGQILEMPQGMSFQIVEPKAAPGYVEYVKQRLHIIAAGFGVTYEMMTGDMSEVNFSSARMRQNDFRRDVEITQYTCLIPTLCETVCRMFVEHAYLAGLIGSTEYGVEHTTPKWSSPNPLQDASADLAEIAGGLSSFSEKLRQRGYKPESVFQELKKDLETLKSLGILDLLLLLQKGRAPSELDAASDDEQKDAPRKKAA
ncbi:MAG TPA: phage portal protein [Acidovorax sp.]|nr:phage portal protein [Acidovorax sp.]